MPKQDMAFVGVHVPRPMLTALQEIARRESNGLSSVIRRIVSAGLEQERRDDRPTPQTTTAR